MSKMEQFNKYFKDDKEIIFQDEKIEHIKINEKIYFHDKKYNDIYFFGDLQYYKKRGY